MKEDFERFYSDEEIKRGLDQLAIFNGPNGARWEVTHANKDHVDALGGQINAGEDYFSCSLGVANILRLSKDSADNFLHVLFTSTPALEQIGEELLAKEAETVSRLLRKAFGSNR